MPAYFNSPSSRPAAPTNYNNSPTSPAAVVSNYQNSPFVLPPGTPYLWYDAQDINLGGNAGINDGDPIGTWKNKGSAGVAGDLTQAVGGSRPALKKVGLAGKLNNLSTVQFSGGTKSIAVAAGLTINQPDMVTIVVKTTNAALAQAFYQFGAGYSQQFAVSGAGLWQLYAGTQYTSALAITANSYFLLLTTWNAASTVFRINKVGDPGITTPGANNATGLTLGFDPVAPGSPMTGEIAEMLVHTGTPPTAANVEAYYDAKYGAGWPQ
jgi:hypothetical protein